MTTVETKPDTMSAPQAAAAIGVSYRVIDYWDRNGVLNPSVAPSRGTGSNRIYSRLDVEVGRLLACLASLGAEAPVLRTAGELLRSRLGALDGPSMVYVDRTGRVHDEPGGHGACWWLNLGDRTAA